MAGTRSDVVEFKSATFYSSWLINLLTRHANKEAIQPVQFVGAEGQNYIDYMVKHLRADPKMNPLYWERRLKRAKKDLTREPIPYFALQSITACAYAAAAENEDKLPTPNRAWDYAVAAAWLGGLFGGGMDRFDQLKRQKDKSLSKAADARHAETRAMKAEARAWYEQRRHSMSKDAAAEALARKEFPVSFRTVREWLKDSAKDID